MLGNQQEPGITASVDSAPTVTSGSASAGTPVIIGGAELLTGKANANEIHGVSSAVRARELFGSEDKSRLTKNILDALGEGASPVLGVAPASSTASKDLSSLGGATGQLSNEIREDPEWITVTVDSSDKKVSFKYEPLGGLTVPSGEVYINPSTRNFKLDAAPSSSGTIEYTALDYAGAWDAFATYDGDVDFYGSLKESPQVVNKMLGVAKQRANEYMFGLCVAAVEPNVDPQTFTNSYDTSRLQLFAPGRLEDGSSMVGAYIGKRADVGLNATMINQRISLGGRPIRSLSLTERSNFGSKNVNPLETLGNSVRVTDDLTTVSDNNSEESNYKYGFSRLAVDFVISVAHEIEEPFIGRFGSSLGVLENLLNKETRPLQSSGVVNSHSVEIERVAPDTARVYFYADIADPIRYIDNDFVIGQGSK